MGRRPGSTLYTPSKVNNWSDLDTWFCQKTQKMLSTNHHMATLDDGDLAQTISITSMSWQDMTRLNGWSWHRIEMNGENLWSYGLCYSQATETERERKKHCYIHSSHFQINLGQPYSSHLEHNLQDRWQRSFMGQTPSLYSTNSFKALKVNSYKLKQHILNISQLKIKLSYRI